MREALKLFGTMAAIIASVSAFHGVRPRPAADSSLRCQREVCDPGAIPDMCSCGHCEEIPNTDGFGECFFP